MWWIALAILITVAIGVPVLAVYVIGREIDKNKDYY